MELNYVDVDGVIGVDVFVDAIAVADVVVVDVVVVIVVDVVVKEDVLSFP